MRPRELCLELLAMNTPSNVTRHSTIVGIGMESLLWPFNKFSNRPATVSICVNVMFPVVTIYATLGDDAIAHGINETQVSTVITTHDLLPKFRKILAKTPRVRTIIYMEDQLKETPKDGYKEGIKIVGYKEVVEMGKQAKNGE